jgi:hypothetical protein
MITNTEARRRINDQAHAVFAAVGLKDGIALTNEELNKTTDVTFWRTGALNPQVNKPTYVTYSVAGTDSAVRGDDKTLLRDTTLAIDVFSKQSFESKSNAILLANIEDTLINSGFEVQFEAEQYEADKQLFHMPITAFKII